MSPYHLSKTSNSYLNSKRSTANANPTMQVFVCGFQVPYSTPGRAMLKTTMGMLGEYEYDTVYNDHVVLPVTWVLYVAFLVTNCIIIMNLLVGDDVASCL